MAPEELRQSLHERPFQPFRIVMTDGVSFDIHYPELLMVGQRSAIVGVVSQPSQELFEVSTKVDLLHIIRVEPIPAASVPPANGSK